MIFNKDRFIVTNKDLKEFAGLRGTLKRKWFNGTIEMYEILVDNYPKKNDQTIVNFRKEDLLDLSWDDEAPMPINRFQELANAVSGTWLYQNDRITKLLYSTMSLCSEAGEIASITTKIGYQGHPLTQEKIDKLALESSDLQWYQMLLAHTLGISAEEILKRNLKKLHERYPNGFSVEESINRKV